MHTLSAHPHYPPISFFKNDERRNELMHWLLARQAHLSAPRGCSSLVTAPAAPGSPRPLRSFVELISGCSSQAFAARPAGKHLFCPQFFSALIRFGFGRG